MNMSLKSFNNKMNKLSQIKACENKTRSQPKSKSKENKSATNTFHIYGLRKTYLIQ